MIETQESDGRNGPGRLAGALLRAAARLPVLAALAPHPQDVGERLAAFPCRDLPLDKPVEIRWNRYQVPHIAAQTDHDLAFALGLVHAHLREAQLALLKRAVQGRIAEMIGPPATGIDEALRILDPGRAARQILEGMPAATRDWLAAFVDGLNWHREHAAECPPEFGLLGIRREPWTVEDIIAIGRLAGADVNWLMYFTLLRERGRPNWPWVWARARAAGLDSATSFRAAGAVDALGGLLAGIGRPGSNAVAVSPAKSASSGALIASDPHLSVSLPNAWLLVGMKSPSYHVVGLMPAGIPVIAIGRNPFVAWGGTNLRALASDLFDVSGLDPSAFQAEPLTIRRRFWLPVRHIRRWSPFGPVISDARPVPTGGARDLALSWAGHHPSDEFTALLAAARSRSAEEFRASFGSFGVSGQNMLFADTQGNIGQILAAAIPVRCETAYPDLVRDPADPRTHWTGFLNAPDLPYAINPAKGYLASANNRPVESDVLIGLFFTNSDRVTRLKEILESRATIRRQDLEGLQTDTRSPAASGLARDLARLIRESGETGPFVDRLATWEGDYGQDSAGAVAFEILLYHLVQALYTDGRRLATALMGQWGFLTKYLVPDLEAMARTERAKLLRRAVRRAARRAKRFRTWGDMHHLDVAHILGKLPLIGAAFRVATLSVGGSRETPMKTSHRLADGPHPTDYGSQARHISDLADLDENHFVLFGGQDGWLGSANFADQVDLWQRRAYIRMPLRPEMVAAEFPHVMCLEPMP